MSLSEDVGDFSQTPMRGDIEVDTYTLPDYSVGFSDNGEALYSVDGWEMTEAQRNSVLYSDDTEYNHHDNEINTYDLTENPVAFNDFGEPVHTFNGWQMTVAQHKALFGESDETCTPEQRDNFDKFLGIKPEDAEKDSKEEIQEEVADEELDNFSNNFNVIKNECGDVGKFFAETLLSDGSDELDTMSMNTGLTHEEITNTAHAVLSDISNELGHDYENMRAWLEYDIAQVKASGSASDRAILDAAIKKAFKADYKGAMHLWDSYHKINNIK